MNGRHLGTRAAWAALLLLSLAAPAPRAAAVPPPAAPAPTAPAADPATLRAVAGVFPPFVMQEDGKLTGFSIDLWNAVAAKLGRPTTIALAPDTAAAFDALRTGKADVVVTGHFYTPERDREFDFTHSIMNAGQQVMVRAGGHGPSDVPLRTFLDLLFSRPALLWFASAFLLVLIPAHLVLFFGGRSGDLIPAEGGYFHRLFHALAWSTEILVGQVPSRPKDKVGRFLAISWRFVGILFVSLFVAKLTASLTYEQFRGLIAGPDDLAGKVVATQAGSTSVDHLRRLGAQIETFPTPEEAYAALLDERVDAVVLAGPALRYFELRQGAGRVKVVGPEFRKSDLGFMVPLDSPLRRQIDSALVALRADGTYERLREKWFGRE